MASQTKQTKITKLNSEQVDPNSLSVIVDANIDKRTLVGHHINSYNLFVSQGLPQIVTQLFKVENTIQNERAKTPEDEEIATIHYLVKFTDVRVGRPVTKNYHSGQSTDLKPNQARRNRLNLSSPLFFDAIIVATAYPKDNGEPRVRTEKILNHPISNIPTMVRSSACHTYEMPPAILKTIQEDPQDPGGYFEIKGGEWCISCIETRLFNSPHIFRNVGHEKEIARLEFISKPGDAFENSSSLTMKYVQNGNIYIRLDSVDYFKMDIPFYIIFRLMGMISDQEICDNIIYGYSSPDSKDIVSDHMFQVLNTALTINDPVFGRAHEITDQGRLLEFFAQQTSIFHQAKNGARASGNSSGSQGTGAASSGIDLSSIDDRTMKYLITNIVSLMDKWVLPHIGVGPETRHAKLRYLGHLIHKMILVEMQIVESTDRDSLKNKRVNAAGLSFAKAFKRDFNLTVIQPIKKKLKKDFTSMPFSQVPLAQSFASAIDAPALEKALIQAIVTGDKELTVKNRQVANRMASEMLHRKNQLNFISTMRVVRTPNTSSSKQDSRADEMRRVHPSYAGFLCPIQSADSGDQVGMVKQMTLGMFLSDASSSALLKQKIRTDPDLIPLRKVFPEQIYENRLTKVLVNGDWIGFTNNPALFWYRYREAKRSKYLISFDGKDAYKNLDSPMIDPYTTIFWNTDANEISFWVDAGRPLRTVIVVRNNSELDPIGREMFRKKGIKDHNPKQYPGGFVQDVMLTKSHIAGLMKKEITIDDLLADGLIDYISPEEMENTYIAQDLETLRKNARDPLHQYTHCEIPQSLIGIPALTCPYTQNNQPPRITFQTNQTKQTNGVYALNWPYRIDKHAFLQYYTEIPIIKTLANKYVYPNGVNAIIAIASYGGYNQEDSLGFNKGASQRGFVKGVNFGFIQADLEKDEHFGNPDIVNTADIKMHANYDKLVRGFPRRGELLTNKDVVIGRYMRIPKPTDKRIYKDTSVMYANREVATVENIIQAHDQDSVRFARVKYSSVRELGIGDKFSSRAGQKGVTGLGYVQSDMMVTKHGIVPDLVLNPHAIPSRMTVGQLIEGQTGRLASIKACIGDATIFKKSDPDAIGDELEARGFDRYSNERMFDGKTGEWIDAEIFIAPTYYQRLQKFVVEEVYSITTGPTCVITRQPLEGEETLP